MGAPGEMAGDTQFLLPAPSTIVSYRHAKSRLLAYHTFMTLLEAGIGFVLGSFFRDFDRRSLFSGFALEGDVLPLCHHSE